MSVPTKPASTATQVKETTDTGSQVTASGEQTTQTGEPNESVFQNLRPFHSPHRLKGQQKIIAEPAFGTVEHESLGDNLCLKTPNPKAGEPGELAYEFTLTSTYKFDFNKLDPSLNKQCLSYGQINGLAGDFYGTDHPISGDAGEARPDERESTCRFLDAWELLAVQPKSVDETKAILAKDKELEGGVLAKYKGSGHEPSWIYATKMLDGLSQAIEFRSITDDREGSDYGNKTYPSYAGLLVTNFDHFGDDAHFAYSTGHKAALAVAAEAGKTKDANKLMVAYAMNAFADHFLEDAFSAGHLRVPRRYLHGPSADGYTLALPDLCANLMHDEDSALGIVVRNPRGDPPWTCVGDEYLHDTTDGAKATLKYCLEALQASVDEIWNAYDAPDAPFPDKFQALQIAPIPDSALEPHDEHLAPLYKLFNGTAWERKWSSGSWLFGTPWELNRTNWADDNYGLYTSVYSYPRLKTSGWWNYPLQLHAASPKPS